MKTLIFISIISFLCDFDNRVSNPTNVVNFQNTIINDSLFNDSINEQKIVSDIIEKMITIDYKYSSTKTVIIEEPGRGYIEMTFMNNVLCKATTKFSYSSGAINSISDFYFWEDKVIYIFQQNEYNTNPKYYSPQVIIKPDKMNDFDESKPIIKENKYFFYDYELVRYIDYKNQKVETLSTVDKIIIKDLLRDANMIIEKSKKTD